MPKYYVPHDQSERLLASGRPLAPGETLNLTKDEEEANKRLIEEGKLLPVKSGKAE